MAGTNDMTVPLLLAFWGPLIVFFFKNLLTLFINQRLDQRIRDPTKYLQNMGGDRPKVSVDPGPARV